MFTLNSFQIIFLFLEKPQILLKKFENFEKLQKWLIKNINISIKIFSPNSFEPKFRFGGFWQKLKPQIFYLLNNIELLLLLEIKYLV